MKYWKRAAGALKDRNSIWRAGLARKTIYRNPDLETAIIKATSHDETRVDYKNMRRVFAWVQTSPYFLRPLVLALSTRLDRTRSWVVALKGLILMHGVHCCKVPSVQKIGHLPFDLSSFHDAHSKPPKTWGFNAFIRAYFTFLDQKSSFMCSHSSGEKGRKKHLKSKDSEEGEQPLAAELETLQKLQSLLDLLIQVKPQDAHMRTVLIMEAMDCIIIEIGDVYNKTFLYITRIFSRIYAANRYEATLALKVLQQANTQAEELSRFSDFCTLLGVLNASEFPKIEYVSEDDIREVQRIVDALSEQKSINNNNNEEDSKSNLCNNVEKAIVVRPRGDMVPSSSSSMTPGSILTTVVVTDKWETFEDDMNINGGIAMDSAYYEDVSNASYTSTPSKPLTIVPQSNASHSHSYDVQPYEREIPDLITF